VKFLAVAANASIDIKTNKEEDEEILKIELGNMATGIRAQTEQREKIDKLQKELRDAHQELLVLRRARYKK
jgi:Spy/CpxP family protein refolding chaperone